MCTAGPACGTASAAFQVRSGSEPHRVEGRDSSGEGHGYRGLGQRALNREVLQDMLDEARLTADMAENGEDHRHVTHFQFA